MSIRTLPFVCFLCLASVAIGQANFSSDPLDAKFITEDVDSFWEAFAQLETSDKNPFEAYIENGTPGLKGFIQHRIINADSLYNMVQMRKTDYIASKNVLADLESKRKRIRAIYSAMKYWHPDAIFPPVYFVVGRFNSGGTVSDDGLILGTEMQQNLESLPALVAHELIHFQQKFETKTENLLVYALNEGSADFIGELISGNNINSTAFQYGEKHMEDLHKEFVILMDKDQNTDWLYGTTGKDDRPNDLGYWIGYKIVAAYFDKKEDKHQAIKDILTIKDPYQLLKESGYLDAEIKEIATWTEQQKKDFLNKPFKIKWSQKAQDEYLLKNASGTKEIQIVVQVPNKEDEVFITGNQASLGNWQPNIIKLAATSPLERTITLKVDFPMEFKFTRGYWGAEGFIKGIQSMGNLKIEAASDKPFNYTIQNWKDKM